MQPLVAYQENDDTPVEMCYSVFVLSPTENIADKIYGTFINSKLTIVGVHRSMDALLESWS